MVHRLLLCDLLPGMEAIKGLSWIQSLLPMRLLHHWDNFRGSTSISSFCQEAAGKNKTTRVATLQKRCYKQSDGRKHRPSHKLSSIHTTKVYVQIYNVVLCQSLFCNENWRYQQPAEDSHETSLRPSSSPLESPFVEEVSPQESSPPPPPRWGSELGGGGGVVPSIPPKERKTRAATLFLSSAFLARRHRENQGNKFSEPETNINFSSRLIKVRRLSLMTSQSSHFSSLVFQLVLTSSWVWTDISECGLRLVWMWFKTELDIYLPETKASTK